jgi:predicted aspartyl protease
LSAGRAGVVLGAALGAGCALPAWTRQAPDFPAAPSSWEVPLYEPLSRPGPYVLANLSGRAPPGGAPPREEVVLYVDSGATHSVLPALTFARLGLETSTSRLATIEDVAGIARAWSGGLIPGVELGAGLALENLVASVGERTPILGADVLAARGWQVDLDRGLLLLGAAPWSAAPGVVVVPTRRFLNHALVDLRIAGQTVPVLIDTGAPFTVVDAAVLRRLGLREERLAHPWPLGVGEHAARIDSVFTGPVALGELALGERRIMGHPGGFSGGRGMLGTDVLFAHLFQVTSGALRLRPRAAVDLIDSAPARVARWPQLPACAGAPGCIAAELIPAGPGDDGVPRVRVRLLAVPSRPFKYLFGCTAADGRLRRAPLWVEVAVRRPAPNVDLQAPFGRETPPAFRQLWARGCARLALLDANPMAGDRWPAAAAAGAAAEARVVMDTRDVTFK